MDRRQLEILNDMKWEEPELPIYLDDDYLEFELLELEAEQEQNGILDSDA